MKYLIVAALLLWRAYDAHSQPMPIVPGGKMDLRDLVAEALYNNPEINAAVHQMSVMEARVAQAGALDDPELEYMREEMPGFKWPDAMYSRLELTQMFRFPSKLSKQTELAQIEAEHAHHDHLEKMNEVLASLKSSYYELWFVQQSIQLTQENARLLRQFTNVAQTKYGVGEVPQQDVLKAYVELAKIDNQLIDLRQRELGAKAMLMATLNRQSKDTLGVATLPDNIQFTPTLDTLQALALEYRPMLLHDSLSVEESRMRLSLARKEFLPDFKLGLQYVTVPIGDFRGWSVRAGITLPFAPWTLGKANARVEEASASISRSKDQYTASRNMVASSIREFYFKAQASKRQIETYRTSILPQARQSLNASLTAYQNGRTDFLMLIDAYRTLVDLQMESLMTRMQFEQAVAELERAVGIDGIATLK